MILIIKNGKVFATHNDSQNDIIDKYSKDYDIIKVADDAIQFKIDENGTIIMPDDPRQSGISYVDLRATGTIAQQLEVNAQTIASLILDNADLKTQLQTLAQTIATMQLGGV